MDDVANIETMEGRGRKKMQRVRNERGGKRKGKEETRASDRAELETKQNRASTHGRK